MAVTLGTNSGFVTSAPTADPAGTNQIIDNSMGATKHTSPSTATKITEIGWWCDTASQEANFEVGLYSDDGAGSGSLLYASRTNAKGTTSGWKKVTGLNWSISPSTVYWIAIQLDNTTTTTNTNIAFTGGNDAGVSTSVSTLSDPLSISIGSADMLTIYAVWEAGPRMKINIGDSWKTVASVKINIGDSWKTVNNLKLNIGDSWKTS